MPKQAKEIVEIRWGEENDEEDPTEQPRSETAYDMFPEHVSKMRDSRKKKRKEARSKFSGGKRPSGDTSRISTLVSHRAKGTRIDSCPGSPSPLTTSDEGTSNEFSAPTPFTADTLAVASLVADNETSQREQLIGNVAIAHRVSQFDLSNKRVQVCVAVTIAVLVSGAIAGILYAVIPRSPTLPTSSPTAAPAQFPTSAPTQLVTGQVGQTLFADSSSSLSGPRDELYFGWSVALASKGDILAATLPFSSSVSIYQYNDTNTAWVKTAEIMDKWGAVDQIALSGDGTTLSMGMPWPSNSEADSLGGRVQVYKNKSGSWQRMGDPIYGLAKDDRLGYSTYEGPFIIDRGKERFSAHSHDSSSLSLSKNGTVLAVGSSAGNYVRVFRFDDNTNQWTSLGNETLRGEGAYDKFGTSVDLSADGQRLVVGAPNSTGAAEPEFIVQTGHARVFQYMQDENSWIQLGQNINGSIGDEQFDDDRFRYIGEQAGWSVSISEDGTVVLVGAIEQALFGIESLGFSDGFVQAFEYDENKTWNRMGNIINAHHFGKKLSSVSEQEIDELIMGLQTWRFPIVPKLAGNGKRIAVSVPAESLHDISGRGVVRIYELQGIKWEEIADPVEGTKPFDHSGRSIALSFDGSRLVVGSPRHNENRPDDGEVRVFDVQSSAESASSNMASSTQITVSLVLGRHKAVNWTLVCGGISMANETVADNSTEVAETFDVIEGDACELKFGEISYIDSYRVFLEQEGSKQALVLVEGMQPSREDVAFIVTSNSAAITIIIQADRNFCDTSWSLQCGNTTLVHPSRLVAGPLINCYRNLAIDQFQETVMGIEEGGQCEFTVRDAFGDGLCCNAGYGFYKIYYGNDTAASSGMLLAEGGKFGSKETKTFTVSRGTLLAPTMSAFPTSTPAPSRPNVPVTVFIKLDDAPEYIGWSLVCGGNTYAAIPSQTYFIEQDAVRGTFRIPEGAHCEFTITDTYGDGISDGYYDIYYGESVETGMLLVRGNGAFGSIATATFTMEKPPSDTSPGTAMPVSDSSSPTVTNSPELGTFDPSSFSPSTQAPITVPPSFSLAPIASDSSSSPSLALSVAPTPAAAASDSPSPMLDSYPTFNPTKTFSPTPEPATFTLLIQLDEAPEETGWELTCMSSGAYGWDLGEVEEGSYTVKTEQIKQIFAVDRGSVCWFTIRDARSDGICCNTGNGFYRFYSGEYVVDEKLFIEGGEFEFEETVEFEVRKDALVKLHGTNG